MNQYILELSQKLDRDYPMLLFLTNYIFLFAVLILVVITLLILPINLIGILKQVLEKIVTCLIMLGLIVWTSGCVIFVFPFHCFKHRQLLLDIRRNKKSKEMKN